MSVSQPNPVLPSRSGFVVEQEPTTDPELSDVIIIRWLPPEEGLEFLVNYIVSISERDPLQSRRRRLADPDTTVEPVPVGTNAFPLNTMAFTEYTAAVSGNFSVNGVPFCAPVTAPLTFTSLERGKERWKVHTII